MTDCLFCRIVAGELPATVVFENATTMAFRDINPKAPSHVLVIPKEHYADIAMLATSAPDLASEVMNAVAMVAESEGLSDTGFRTIFNTGADGGQEVAHVHAHVLGGAPVGPMVCR